MRSRKQSSISKQATYEFLIANEFHFQNPPKRHPTALAHLHPAVVVSPRSAREQGGRMTPILRTALALVALCITALGANAQRSFTVGSATAAPGQKATGFIDVPAGVDAALQIPVVVVNGAKLGPVLSIVAGSHGTEYATIVAVERLIHELDPAEISGTVILVPLVNVNSFLQKVRSEEHTSELQSPVHL